MQTILGAGGQIVRELARELTHSFNAEPKLVSRNPHKVTIPGAVRHELKLRFCR